MARWWTALLCVCGISATALAQDVTAPGQLTLNMLGLRSEGVILTLVIPAAGRMERDAFREAPSLAGMLQNARQQLLAYLESQGFPPAESLATLLRQCGLEADEPIGLFVSLDPLRERAQWAAEIAAKPLPWWHLGSEHDDRENLPYAHWVMAAHPENDSKSAETLQALAARWNLETKAQHGLVFLSNNGNFLAATLAMRANPVATDYSPPPHDEAVLLTRLDLTSALLPEPQSVIRAHGSEWDRLASLEATSHRAAESLFSSDPCVTTLGWRNSTVTLQTTLRLEQHPTYAPLAGGMEPSVMPRDAPGLVAFANLRGGPRKLLQSRLSQLLSLGEGFAEAKAFRGMLDTADEFAMGWNEAGPWLAAATANMEGLVQSAGQLAPLVPLATDSYTWAPFGTPIHMRTANGLAVLGASPDAVPVLHAQPPAPSATVWEVTLGEQLIADMQPTMEPPIPDSPADIFSLLGFRDILNRMNLSAHVQHFTVTKEVADGLQNIRLLARLK